MTLLPSPKVHVQVVGALVVESVNVTVSGAIPEVGVPVNDATGASGDELTVWLPRRMPVPAAQVLLPLYVAVILCEPTGRFEMVILAAPVEFSWIFDEPDQTLPLTLNVTFSRSVPAEKPAELFTLAVNVTD